VGEDENGKTLTSLMVVPGDVPVRAAKRTTKRELRIYPRKIGVWGVPG
jgi:hypothetical protein